MFSTFMGLLSAVIVEGINQLVDVLSLKNQFDYICPTSYYIFILDNVELDADTGTLVSILIVLVALAFFGSWLYQGLILPSMIG